MELFDEKMRDAFRKGHEGKIHFDDPTLSSNDNWKLYNENLRGKRIADQQSPSDHSSEQYNKVFENLSESFKDSFKALFSKDNSVKYERSQQPGSFKDFAVGVIGFLLITLLIVNYFALGYLHLVWTITKVTFCLLVAYAVYREVKVDFRK